MNVVADVYVHSPGFTAAAPCVLTSNLFPGAATPTAPPLASQHPHAHRQKHKQELVTLRSELKQLQAESKSGQKGKDLASKELEAAKKKLCDLKAKLDALTTEKLAMQQVRMPK